MRMFLCKQISQIVLITFSGMDGAGKSTQIVMLSDFFKSRGASTFNYWARGGYTPGFQFLKCFLRFVMGKKLPRKGRSTKRSQMLANPKVSKIWLWMAICDLIFFYTNLRFKSYFGNIVICDRFVEDTRLDFSLNFPSIKFEKFLVWRFLQLIKPKPDIAFLLMISPELSISRGLEKEEPFPDDLITLEKRYKLYCDPIIFEPEQYNILDCSIPKEEVRKYILTLVSSKLKVPPN
jgi:thymidylate kinase